MPAPTALKSTPADPPQVADIAQDEDLNMSTDTPLLETTADSAVIEPSAELSDEMVVDEESRPRFAPAKELASTSRTETRQVRIPPHRYSPLKAQWPRIFPPLVEHLKLQARMNVKRKMVELRTSKHTTDPGAIQAGEDFVRAFTLGFDIDDAIALLRLQDLYIETFEVKDVKTLHGDHLARAIGRIAGKDGKTKFAIENATRTRIVLADSKIHILGGFKQVQLARRAVCSLILGAPPGKVWNSMRSVSARMKERF